MGENSSRVFRVENITTRRSFEKRRWTTRTVEDKWSKRQTDFPDRKWIYRGHETIHLMLLGEIITRKSI